MGRVVKKEFDGHTLHLEVSLPLEFSSGIQKGASVSVDGVCLTMVNQEGEVLHFDLISETLERTTLGDVECGDLVNCERSLKMGSEIGGHLLSGHIFGKCRLEKIEKNIFHLTTSKQIMRYLFPKGYIALNGVSLTLVDVDLMANRFTVHLIPETLRATTFGQKQAGALINCEIDSTTQTIVESVARIQQMGYS